MIQYKIYKDVIDTCVCLFCCYELYNMEIINTPYIMLTYSIIDLPFNTTSLKVHHVITAIAALTYIYDTKTMERHDMLYEFLKCEYCTLFLSLKKLINHVSNTFAYFKYTKVCEDLLKICFFLSFVYYRLYKPFDILIQMDSTYLDVGLIYHIGVYSMYVLNLYWFTKMIKKFCRTMEKHIVVRNTDIINLSQYVYFIIPFYNILSIKRISLIIALLDSISVGIYCFFVHMYNADYYKSLVNKTRVNPDLYLYEKISIHLRSYMGLCVVCLSKDIVNDFLLIIISCIFHGYMINKFMIYYYNEFDLQPCVLKHEKIIHKIPIFFDNLCLYLISNHYEKLVVNSFLFIMLFIMIIKPFGKNNHQYMLYPFITNFMITRGINHP